LLGSGGPDLHHGIERDRGRARVLLVLQ